MTISNTSLRADLERRYQEYLAAGGTVTEVPIGVSAYSDSKPLSEGRTESMRRIIKRGCNEHGVSIDAP